MLARDVARIGALCVAFLSITGLGLAAEAPATVRIKDSEVFSLQRGRGELSAEKRAQQATEVLAAAVDDTDAEVRTERRGEFVLLYVGSTPVVELDAADAQAAGDANVADYAARVNAKVKEALKRERRRTMLASTVFSVSLVVLFSLLALAFIRRIGELARRVRALIAEHPERVPPVRLHSLELLSPSTFRNALTVGAGALGWIGQLLVAYGWLVVTLSMFESTRGYTARLTGAFTLPLASFAGRLAASLPVIAALAIAGLALLLTVRFVGLFFRSVARGETQLAWLAPDLAPATSLLLRGAMVVCCLIFVAPVVTGDARGALSVSGWLLFIVVALGALPLCASALVGISLLFGRRVKAGDWIELGERAGRVTELGLFDLQILGDGQTVARVPYLLLLTRTLQVSPGGPRVRVVMTLDAPTDLAKTLDRVLQAIAQVGAEPRIEVDEVTSRSLRLSIAVTSDAAQASAQLCQAALDAAKDVQSAAVREAVA